MVKKILFCGTNQLNNLAEQDTKISSELEKLNITGTKIIKNIYVIPINNTLIYIEPIYQVMLNESKVPLLKKIIIASGNKVAIGDNLKEALSNLLSQNASSIQVDTENIDDLIEQIINANNKLEKSNLEGNWEMIGKDMSDLQTLIKQLGKLVNKDNSNNTIKNTTDEIKETLNLLNI